MQRVRDLIREFWGLMRPSSFWAVLSFLVLIGVDTFDSFGLDQDADEQAQRTIGAIEAPGYGWEKIDGKWDRPGQDSIAVVLVDSATLYQEQWGAPLDYANQSAIVGAIAAYNPAAIFLDFSYSWAHGAPDEIEAFRDDLLAYSDGGRIPIFLGQVAGITPQESENLKPLQRIESVGVNWNSRNWIEYPFRSARAPDADPNDGVVPPLAAPTAAVALYHAFCQRQAERVEAVAHGQAPDIGPPITRCHDWNVDLEDSLSVDWGFGASRHMREAMDDTIDKKCVLVDGDGPWGAASQTLRNGLAGSVRAAEFHRSARDTTETQCQYHDAISALAVLDPPDSTQEFLEQTLKNRIVLVGASHSLTNDFHDIPHVGNVPGVLIHAMALDNLITYQENYTRPPPNLFLDLDGADVIELSMTLLLTLLMARAYKVASAPEKRAHRGAIVLLWAGICATLLAGVLIFERLLMHWPSLNAVGVAGLVFLIVVILESGSEKLENHAARD